MSDDAELFATTYRDPDEGDVIELPDGATTAVERVGDVEIGLPTLAVEVVGTGERAQYVILRNDADGDVCIPDGSNVLGVDGWTDSVYFAVPTEVYE
ncbi:hypothetical protein BRC72_01010 [Halobacteriales archaeon QH_7_66_36]|nr:MAG: hypothetical protein BRC72_01010 [Halobacteriales archaeon QH_7_66_36]